MMHDENNPAKISTVAWIGGGAVVLATILAVILLALLFSMPWTFHPRHAGGLMGPGLLGSMIVSGIGGFWMLAVTKRPWWIVPPVIISASTVLLLIYAKAMGVAGMH